MQQNKLHPPSEGTQKIQALAKGQLAVLGAAKGLLPRTPTLDPKMGFVLIYPEVGFLSPSYLPLLASYHQLKCFLGMRWLSG